MSELNLNELQEETENLSFGQKLMMIFTDPARAFKSMKENPKILGIYLITAALIIITIVLNTYSPMAKEQMIQQLQSTGQVVTEQTINTLLIVSTIFGGIIGALIPFLIAFIYHIIVMFMSKTGYKKTLAVYLFAGIISQIGAILSGILTRITGTAFSFSPAMFIDQTTSPMMYSLLSIVNIFTIWSMIVLYIGFKETHEMKSKEASIVVGVPVVFLIIVTMVTSSLLF